MKLSRAAVGIACFVTFARITAATPAEVTVFTVRAGATVLQKIRPEFESATGHRLNVVYDPVLGSYARRINAGEPFDIYITAPPGIDGLIKDGKIVAETRTNLFHSGMGVEVRAGASKPDISSVEAFKRERLNTEAGQRRSRQRFDPANDRVLCIRQRFGPMPFGIFAGFNGDPCRF